MVRKGTMLRNIRVRCYINNRDHGFNTAKENKFIQMATNSNSISAPGTSENLMEKESSNILTEKATKENSKMVSQKDTARLFL